MPLNLRLALQLEAVKTPAGGSSPPPETFYRITETGDRRITEAADPRVLE